jgi:FkbM family methyltransferase
VLKKLIRACGYDVRRRRWTPQHLAQLLSARTVVDVGVAFGTWELYRAFPEARFLLIEPLRDYASDLERIAEQYRCDIVYKALGEVEERRKIHVDPQILTRSSLHERTELTRTGSTLQEREIEVTTLDSLLDSYPDLEGPLLLKIDTEGYELNVIRGGDAFLQRTDVVIAEVSVAERFSGSYAFAEFIAAMDERGFSVHDFLRLSYRRDGTGAQLADIAFINRARMGG